TNYWLHHAAALSRRVNAGLNQAADVGHQQWARRISIVVEAQRVRGEADVDGVHAWRYERPVAEDVAGPCLQPKQARRPPRHVSRGGIKSNRLALAIELGGCVAEHLRRHVGSGVDDLADQWREVAVGEIAQRLKHDAVAHAVRDEVHLLDLGPGHDAAYKVLEIGYGAVGGANIGPVSDQITPRRP